MSRILSLRKWVDAIFITGVVLMTAALILLPEAAVNAARDGLDLCMQVIVPSLFPFFVLSTLIIELGMTTLLEKLTGRFMGPLFHVSGKCTGAYLLGILGGYPVGAKTAISLYESGEISKEDAGRLLSFCNNSGPAFILGVTGAGIFCSTSAGVALYLCHILASLLVGLIFRNYGTYSPAPYVKRNENKEYSFFVAFPYSVKKAFESTLNICSFVIFFTVFLRLIFQTGFFSSVTGLFSMVGIHSSVSESLLTGMIEMTSGVWSLREMAGTLGNRLSMAAFILGWAGLSVHCQVLSFLGSSGLSPRTYVIGKLLHGLLSAGLMAILSVIMQWNIPVSAQLAAHITSLADMDFMDSFLPSLCIATGFLVVIKVCQYFCKSSRNSMKADV